MNQQEIEYNCHTLVEQAEKRLNPGCMEAICTSKESRFIQAKELLEQAGNNFKLCKKWFEGGECFERCAKIEETNKENPTKYWEEAAHCFGFVDNKSKK